MKFAFLILGDFCATEDRAEIHHGSARMIGVSTLDEACQAARELYEEGVGCIELCGAFGPDGARRIIEVTENKIPVGYVTHLPEQEEIYQAAFSDKKAETVKIIDVTGVGEGAVFLLRGRANILFEAGMAYAADAMIEKIKQELQGEPLHAVLLSHSHYDHVAGLPAVRKEWPDVKVYASERAKEILVKPGALKTIRRLSGEAAEASGLSWDSAYDDRDIQADIGLKDGETTEISGDQVYAFATPGHTKCSMSYVINGEVMLCSETVGVMNRNQEYMPSFLVDYKGVEDSIRRSAEIPVREIILNHYGLVEEKDKAGIWEFLLETARKSRDLMLDILNETDSDEEALRTMERTFHSTVDKKDQPDEAFYINAASMIKTLRRQYPEKIREDRRESEVCS